MKHNKRRAARRVLVGLCLALVALLAYSVAGAYAPFIRCPALEDQARIEARAEAMSRDEQTADRATILETRGDALDERVRLLSQAKQEIILATYDCRDGESTRDVLCVALDRADAGVKVRMLVDGISGWLKLSANPMFQALNAHENFELRLYNPPLLLLPWRHMGRMHEKYVIVDDVAYILGGRNMFDHFIGEYPFPSYSRDREALVYNAAHGTQAGRASSLYQIKAHFEEMWGCEAVKGLLGKPVVDERREEIYAWLRQRLERLRAEKPELFEEVDYGAMTLETKGIHLISGSHDIYAKEPEVFSTLCALMERAERDIVIHSPYAVLNDAMRRRLSAIAAKTPVTLMINAVENGANVVASGDYTYHRDEVLSTGMRVLEYAGGDSYHGKAVAIDDDMSIIGSFNLDLRSTYVDTELMLLVRGEAFNALLRRHMDALHADCRRVIDGKTAEVPEGLTIPPLPLWKAAALRVIGALMQPVRNLV